MLLTIFNNWISSLAMLKPSSFISWISQSWQLFVKGCKETVSAFWWLLIVIFISTGLFSYLAAIATEKFQNYIALVAIIMVCGTRIIYAAFLFLMRPQQKGSIDLEYFVNYLFFSVGSWVIVFCFFILPISTMVWYFGGTESLYNDLVFSSDAAQYIKLLCLLTFPTYIFASFYWVDSQTFPPVKVIIPLKKATKLIIYSIPLLLVFVLIGVIYVLLKFIFFLSPIAQFLTHLPVWCITFFMIISFVIQFIIGLFSGCMAYVYYLQKKD